jgi:hypothetical protein
MEFEAWPKIARLNRDIVVTEKIDGTNAAVIIEEAHHSVVPGDPGSVEVDGVLYEIGAQSRTRLITPEQDNFGFARWVREHQADLVRLLGPGRHFGEWWGSGIQRGYGLPKGEKRFSLFNTERYGPFVPQVMVNTVPVLYRGPFSEGEIRKALGMLDLKGSRAAPGFMKPEGVVVYHTAARVAFKVTLEGDEAPKGSVHWGGDGV